MDSKQLKKLAKACRDAGISSYTCPEFSFTLTDTPPPSKAAKKRAAADSGAAEIEQEDTWDSLTEEQKLFFSVNPGALEETSEQ